MDLKETDILGDRIGEHWYYVSKARAMQRMLGTQPIRQVLDVGAGSGFFSRYLLANTALESACCVDTSYRADGDETEAGKPILFRTGVDQCDCDLVLMMDVLEHVEDDVGLLVSYRDKVPPGSRFLISVPAFQWLWSDHDVFLEHQRRYRLTQLEAVVEQAGLRVITGTYYFAAVFPLAALLRLAGKVRKSSAQPRSQLKLHHPVSNTLLALASQWELPLMSLNRGFGLTIFCLAEKPR